MRSEGEMLELILDTARNDDRIRAVIMNGSRANPNLSPDPFQDFDIVYVVAAVAAFRHSDEWISRFGAIMVMQLPDDMQDPPPNDDGSFTYLMQFADGNRIDLRLHPLARLHELRRDSLSRLLLDKDGIIEPFAPASDSDYLPRPPTAKAFSDCCNEFWWVCPYVAKGLWRGEIIYAKHMLDQMVRAQLMKMLTWHIGVKTRFLSNPGYHGRYFKKHLEPEQWDMLLNTYSDATYDDTWEALYTMCDLFRTTALQVAQHFCFDYPHGDDERVSAHVRHVRYLPRDAKAIY
jgi:aminoglycoside 6-adenylyltransferase